MIAYCGMDCEKCEGYLATKKNSDTMRARVAEKWSREYNADITPGQINCSGCKSTGIQFYFTEKECPIRKCNIKRNTENCAKCSQYRCETLEGFIAVAAPVGDALEKLRSSSK